MTTVAIKERPLTLADWEVHAVLHGRKTQLRRIITPQPTLKRRWWLWAPKGAALMAGYLVPSAKWRNGHDPTEGDCEHCCIFRKHCPLGKTGDRLWVREIHYVENAGYPDGRDRFVLYKATDQDAPVSKWTPSIHMPRWASRLTLAITDVRVQRLHDITVADAKDEGVTLPYPDDPIGAYLGEFKRLWQTINDPDSWNANPWVFAITFKRLEKVA